MDNSFTVRFLNRIRYLSSSDLHKNRISDRRTRPYIYGWTNIYIGVRVRVRPFFLIAYFEEIDFCGYALTLIFCFWPNSLSYAEYNLVCVFGL